MKKFIIYLIVVLSLNACEDVVNVEINSFTPSLVVEGSIYHYLDRSTMEQTIQLSEVADFLDQSGATPVVDARIEVTDGQNSYQFSHTIDGKYNAEVPTQIGRTYSLKIDYKDQTIEAEETLVGVTSIDSIYTIFEEETTFVESGYFVKIDSKDEPGVDNYYHWKQFVNDTFAIIPDPGNQADLIATDEFFNGQPFLGYKPNEEIAMELGDHVRVEQIGITKEYYDYLFQVFGQTLAQPIIGSTPPTKIIGNLYNRTSTDNFVLGYFSAASIATAETIVSE